MDSKQTPLLRVGQLTKEFPIRQGWMARTVATVHAVDRVSLEVYPGETLGLVGESGSGKTTLGRTILRAVEPTSGSIRFRIADGEEVDVTGLDKNGLRGFRRHMQMIFQDPYSSLNPRMTVREIIAEPLVATGRIEPSGREERVREVAQSCRINVDYLRRYPHAFSGGERQRIGIARALVLHPEFVVCDEPVSALDVSIQAEILNLLADLQKKFGLTYLFIAHDLSVVEHICDRIAVMYLGRLVESAPTTLLFERPMHPYTEALLSAIPAADPDEVMRPLPLSGEIPSPINPPSGCTFHPRCPHAEEVCRTTAPALTEAAPAHWVACHRAVR